MKTSMRFLMVLIPFIAVISNSCKQRREKSSTAGTEKAPDRQLEITKEKIEILRELLRRGNIGLLPVALSSDWPPSPTLEGPLSMDELTAVHIDELMTVLPEVLPKLVEIQRRHPESPISIEISSDYVESVVDQGADVLRLGYGSESRKLRKSKTDIILRMCAYLSVRREMKRGSFVDAKGIVFYKINRQNFDFILQSIGEISRKGKEFGWGRIVLDENKGFHRQYFATAIDNSDRKAIEVASFGVDDEMGSLKDFLAQPSDSKKYRYDPFSRIESETAP